jgi:hypothetical protein
MQKVLIITNHFPPDGEIGAVRPFEFARNFKEFGWCPVILTVDEKYYQVLDRDNDLEGMIVYRTRKMPTIGEFIRYFYKKIKKIRVIYSQLVP